MYFWGKDMFLCAYLHQLCLFVPFNSDFLLPIFSKYPMLDSGGARHLREIKHLNSLHIFTFGDMSMINVVLSTHSLHVIPVLVFLWFLLFALSSKCICVI